MEKKSEDIEYRDEYDRFICIDMCNKIYNIYVIRCIDNELRDGIINIDGR